MADQPDLQPIADEFRYFATHRAGSYAPLYARLGSAIADDPVLLDVAACARRGQSRPDLLLGVIHDLLLRHPEHPAARFYPSLTTTPATGDPAPDVLDFAHDHLDLLTTEVGSRLVQTNEVGRCAFLAPAMRAAARRAPGAMALLEVGASAGLNLLLDRYGYRYRRPAATDRASSTVVGELPGYPVLDCVLDGPGTPPLNQSLDILWRAGIDLNPLHLEDPADRRWLRALIWPDHRDRAAQLDAALHRAASCTPFPVVHDGDAAEQLPRLAAQAPSAAHLVVYHCAVLAHMPPTAREEFTATVLACSVHRPLSWVQAEPRLDGDPRRLRLTECRDGRIVADHPLGSYQPHGKRMRWETLSAPDVDDPHPDSRHQ